MTESDWLTTTTRPADMLRHVRAKASARKLQLISCGCARLIERHLTDEQRNMLTVVERYAEGLEHEFVYQRLSDEINGMVTSALYRYPYGAADDFDPSTTLESAVALAMQAVVSTPADEGVRLTIEWVRAAEVRAAGPGIAVSQDMARQICDLFREVIGNPFAERVVVGPGWERSGGGVAGWMTRVGETARLIAAGVQAEQAFDRLPILADALEDDGCTDAELLAHLRGPGPHVRGCWALDLVLGKG